MILTLLILLATVARAAQHSPHQSKGTKTAVGVALYIPGQVTLNVLLVSTALIALSMVPDAGTLLFSVNGAIVVGMWLIFGLFWFYGWVFSLLGRASDVPA